MVPSHVSDLAPIFNYPPLSAAFQYVGRLNTHLWWQWSTWEGNRSMLLGEEGDAVGGTHVFEMYRIILRYTVLNNIELLTVSDVWCRLNKPSDRRGCCQGTKVFYELGSLGMPFLLQVWRIWMREASLTWFFNHTPIFHYFGSCGNFSWGDSWEREGATWWCGRRKVAQRTISSCRQEWVFELQWGQEHHHDWESDCVRDPAEGMMHALQLCTLAAGSPASLNCFDM